MADACRSDVARARARTHARRDDDAPDTRTDPHGDAPRSRMHDCTIIKKKCSARSCPRSIYTFLGRLAGVCTLFGERTPHRPT